MLKKITKKLAVAIMAVMLATGFVSTVNLFTGSNIGVETVYASGGIYAKLMSLKNKFPQGAYWNHVVPEHEAWQNCYNEAYADSVTWSPCATHGALVGAGTVDCNYFDGGWQCCGFARKVFYDLYGERESSNSLIRQFDPYSVSVGDYVHFKGFEHYAVVLSVSDYTFTVVECNLSGSGGQYNCYINWGQTYNKNQIDYYVHSHNYDAVENSNNNPTPAPANSKKQNPMTLQVTSKTLWLTTWQKESFNIGVKKAKGKVTYSVNAAGKKAGIKVSSKGKVTVPKKCKKGTYKITVKAAGNGSYKAVKKTVTVYVK